jgi:hypothetical protein
MGKGILVIAQGGVHLKYDAKQTYDSIIREFLDDPILRDCARQNKAYMMWTSYQAQSESYREKYPDQNLAVGIPFNEKMGELMRKDQIQNLVTMDWLNFTTGAQHSDGLHLAAQVNYLKAQHVIAVANLMHEERMVVSFNETPPLDCGCPETCDAATLNNKAKGFPFACKKRIKYLLERNSSISEACTLAVNQNWCGPACHPKNCSAGG